MIIEHSLHGADLDDLSIKIDLPPGTRDMVVALTARYKGKWRARGTLIGFTFADSCSHVAIPNSNHLRSSAAGTFFYLNLLQSDGNVLQPTVEHLEVPAGAVELELSGSNWLPGMGAEIHELLILPLGTEGISEETERQIPEWLSARVPAPLRKAWNMRSRDRGAVEPGNSSEWNNWAVRKEILPRPRQLEANQSAYRAHGEKPAHRYKVALICDEFTFNSFAPEFDHAVLEPNTWRETMEAYQPDIFFCESAWSGVDSARRPWRGQIYASAKFRFENRGKLLEILAYCREHSIPTVFWNKEDPTHFFDRVNDFVSTATKFDYVLTTAEEMVDEYAKFLPRDRVGVLQFGVQPRDFNPLPGAERSSRAVFAGAWYDVHPERCETMRRGFEWVLKSDLELQIYDRNKRNPAIETLFPEPYADLVRPAVSHKATAALYRGSLMGLNFNTVVDSTTMFARRVFELAASGSLVVSNYSPGIERIYGDDVVFYDRDGIGAGDLDQKAIARKVDGALRTTLQGHTYRHRWESVLEHLGLPFSSSRPAPTLMVEVATEEDARSAIALFHKQHPSYSRLLLVVNRSVPSSRTGRFVTAFSSPSVDVISAELIATEKVPSTNFVTTPDVIVGSPGSTLSGDALSAVLIHGEYSRLPIRAGAGSFGMSAGTPASGTRLAAVDVVSAILQPNAVTTALEVPTR